MLELTRGRLAIKYIFFEMLPSFLLGVVVFVFILLMFQALRLTEFILVHGVSMKTIMEIVIYLSVSFLPVILPMSLLFSILLTYGRLSQDSEIVAMKALGLELEHLLAPALLLAIVTTILSAQTSFYLAPWGNRQFEVLINELSRAKASVTIREGVFSEGFFDLVVYANKVDSNQGHLKNVFIYDERNPTSPLTIIAKEGELVQSKDPKNLSAALRLIDGDIHRTTDSAYTKIKFDTYDINLSDNTQASHRSKSLQSMDIFELKAELQKTNLEPDQIKKIEIEFYRRWSLSFACLIFGLLGVGLGTTTNRRSAKSSGFVISLLVIISYWLMYIVSEGLARNVWMPTWVALWMVNALFFAFAIYTLKKLLN